MKIIISPAKTMRVDREAYEVKGLPRFLEETRILMEAIKKLSFDEAKRLWKCSDKLTELNVQRFAEMDLEKGLTPALFSYEGLQYQNMGPGVFSCGALTYIGARLRILSGFYGILGPFDGVVPYRLEMQAKLSVDGCKDLYQFWGGKIYEAIADECGETEPFTILNLASKEYSQVIEPYVGPECRFVTVDFGELVGGKVKQKATPAKMARGDMVRFLAEGNITDVEGVKNYTGFGFQYSEALSERDRLVFVK